MTKPEWIEVVAEMRTRWPHSQIPDPTIAVYFDDLEHLPVEQVRTAVRALAIDGRDYPPSAGHILAKVADLDSESIDYGEAWRLAKKAALKADADAGRAWLTERCPAAVAAVEQLTGWPLTFLLEDESTVRAQFRDIYRGIVAAQKRDAAYAGLPSAGLRQLERGPRKIGEALKRALPERSAT